jgi:predicted amidohydrolase
VWARQEPGNLDSQYDLLIYIANWPEKRNRAWNVLLQARAIENQCFVAGVNRVGKDGNRIFYSGDSSLIDPMGKIIYQKNNSEDIFTYTLKKETITEYRNQFPFWKESDYFLIKD